MKHAVANAAIHIILLMLCVKLVCEMPKWGKCLFSQRNFIGLAFPACLHLVRVKVLEDTASGKRHMPVCPAIYGLGIASLLPPRLQSLCPSLLQLPGLLLFFICPFMLSL